MESRKGAAHAVRIVVGIVGLAGVVLACGRSSAPPSMAKKAPDDSITIAAALGNTQVRSGATNEVLARITVEATGNWMWL